MKKRKFYNRLIKHPLTVNLFSIESALSESAFRDSAFSESAFTEFAFSESAQSSRWSLAGMRYVSFLRLKMVF